MPLFDFVCDTCGARLVDWLVSRYDVEVVCYREKAHGPMARQPGVAHFGGMPSPHRRESHISRGIRRVRQAERKGKV